MKDVVQRRDHKRPGHQTGEVGVEHNHDAPHDMFVIRENEGSLVHQMTS